MFAPLLYWVALPVLAGWFVIRWIQKTSPLRPAPDAARLFEERPLERRRFRAARRDAAGLALLGDYDSQPQAVEAAYAGRERALAEGRKGEFLVFNDRAELLEQVDA